MENTEIEVKVKLLNPNQVTAFISTLKEYTIIQQTYLFINDEMEVRLRKQETDTKQYYLTIKSGSGLVRTEMEQMIPKQEFNRLMQAAHGPFLMKKRYTFKKNGFVMELDVFDQRLENLMLLEIELTNVEEVKKALQSIPFTFKDVTSDKSFKNKALWQRLKNIEIPGL